MSSDPPINPSIRVRSDAVGSQRENWTQSRAAATRIGGGTSQAPSPCTFLLRDRPRRNLLHFQIYARFCPNWFVLDRHSSPNINAERRSARSFSPFVRRGCVKTNFALFKLFALTHTAFEYGDGGGGSGSGQANLTLGPLIYFNAQCIF